MNLSLSRGQWITILLADATAIIHLILGFVPEFNPIFILNGLGFFGLAAAYFIIPQTAPFRPQIKWAFIGYTLVTIILYFVMNDAPFASALGLITKAIEVALVVMLFKPVIE